DSQDRLLNLQDNTLYKFEVRALNALGQTSSPILADTVLTKFPLTTEATVSISPSSNDTSSPLTNRNVPVVISADRPVRLVSVLINGEDKTADFPSGTLSRFAHTFTLTDGSQTIVVFARDVYNNPGEAQSSFVVDGGFDTFQLAEPANGASSQQPFDIIVESQNDLDCRYSLDHKVVASDFPSLTSFDSVAGSRYTVRDVSFTDENSHLLYLVCREAQGVSLPSFQIRADGQAPSISLFTSPASPIAELPAAFSLSVSSDEDVLCRYSTSSTAPYSQMTAFDTAGFSAAPTAALQLTSEGTFSYTAQCEDRAGRMSEKRTIEVNVNPGLPLVILSHTEELQPSNRIPLSIETNKHATCKYDLSDSQVTAGTQLGAANSFSHTLTLTVNPSTAAVYVRCFRDRESLLTLVPLKIDTTPPRMAFVDDTSPGVTDGTTPYQYQIYVSWRGVDDESGSLGLLYNYTLFESVSRKTVINWTLVEPNGTNNSFSGWIPIEGLLDNTRYQFEVKAINALGQSNANDPNRLSNGVTTAFPLTNAPSLTLTPATSTTPSRSPVSFAISSNRTVQIRTALIDGEEQKADFGTGASKTFSKSLVIPDGAHWFYVAVNDSFDNLAEARTTFIIDNGQDTLTLAQPANGASSVPTSDIIVESQNNLDCRYRWEFEPRTSEFNILTPFSSVAGPRYTISSYLFLDEEWHTLYVLCKEGQNTFLSSFQVRYDNQDPQVQAFTTPASPLAELPANFRLSARADEDVLCRYSNSSTAPYSQMTAFDTADFSAAPTAALQLTSVGTFSYTLQCADRAGRLSEKQSIDVVVDTDIPFVIVSHTEALQPSNRIPLFVETNKQATCSYSTSNPQVPSGSPTLTSSDSYSHKASVSVSPSATSLFVRCFSPSGTATLTVSFQIDASRPLMLFVNDSTPGQSFGTTPSKYQIYASWRGTDPESEHLGMTYNYTLYSLNGTRRVTVIDWTLLPPNGPNNTFSGMISKDGEDKPIELLEHVTYKFDVKAINAFGMSSDVKTSLGVNVSLPLGTDPVLTLLPATSSAPIRAFPLIFSVQSDREVQLQSVLIDGKERKADFPVGFASSFSKPLVVPDGFKSLSVRAMDRFGKVGDASTSFVVDITKDTLHLAQPSGRASASQPFDVVVESQNTLDCRYSNWDMRPNTGDFNFLNPFDSTTSTTYTVKNVRFLDEEWHTLYVLCKEVQSPTPSLASFQVRFDSRAPLVQVFTSPASPIAELPAVFSLSASSDEDVLCRYSTFSNAPYTDMTLFDNTSYSTLKSAPLQLDTVGTFFYTVQCEDRAGWLSDKKSIAVVVDPSVPLRIIDHTEPLQGTTIPELIIETNKHASCRFDSTNPQQIAGMSLNSLNSLSHTISVSSASSSPSFNVLCFRPNEQARATIQFQIDTTPPRMAFVNDSISGQLSGTTPYQHQIYASWRGVDDESGSFGLTYNYTFYTIDATNRRVTLINWTAVEPTGDNNTFSGWISIDENGEPLNLSDQTTYKFDVRAINALGRQSAQVSSSGVRTALPLAASNCANGERDGSETDVDCGGICGATCGTDKTCQRNADCSLNYCHPTTLKCAVPSCTDTLRNGNESDTDCGGSCSVKCALNKACRVSPDCSSGQCTNGLCSINICANSIKDSSETDLDCGGSVCGATCRNGALCLNSTDCQSNYCNSFGRCATASCSDIIKNGNETDVDCGSSCSKCAQGKDCRSSSDCSTGLCSNGHCAVNINSTCTNNVQDSSETDLDCGGTCSTACGTGKKCLRNVDCQNNYCDISGFCSVPSCTDDKENGNETDVDCGGPSCGKCDLGLDCKNNNDCSTGLCKSGACSKADTCSDGKQGQSETDVDCGGTCPTFCAKDQRCERDGDCVSGLKCLNSICATPEPIRSSGDTDNDGMPDDWETRYGFDPNDASDAGVDSDNDGLTNLEEYSQLLTNQWALNPKNPDTDGDGFTDGDEVSQGSDPTDPSSVPEGASKEKGGLGWLWLLLGLLVLLVLATVGYLLYDQSKKGKQEPPATPLFTPRPSQPQIRKPLFRPVAPKKRRSLFGDSLPAEKSAEKTSEEKHVKTGPVDKDEVFKRLSTLVGKKPEPVKKELELKDLTEKLREEFAAPKASSEKPTETPVKSIAALSASHLYTTPNGKRFHHKDCITLSGKGEGLKEIESEEKARQQGLAPCSVCMRR
ncbi:MAG: hypothetical protein Q7S65_02030, partial [Nanoarchaeota archaeon]|nr:hypothetical protein [Nanoarchaeota archaeon]